MHVLLQVKFGTRHLTHMRVAYVENPRSVFARTHTCVWQKQGTRGQASGCLIAPAALGVIDVRVCDFATMCVADACRRVCCGRGCCDLAGVVGVMFGSTPMCVADACRLAYYRRGRCCDLAACRFNKQTYTHAHTRTDTHADARTCLRVSREPRSWSLCDCTHAHGC